MTHRNAKIRPVMTAIAAVLALSSTALLAQVAPDVAPVPVAPAAPIVESAPATPIVSEPSAAVVSDPIAPSAKPASTATKSTKSTTARRTASVARTAKAAPPVARAATPAPAAAVPVAAPAQTVAPAPAPLAAVPAAPPPAVAATPPVQETPTASNAMLPIAGAVGLALLALIGLAVAMRRRKLRREEEVAVAYEVEPAFEGPAPVDPLFAEQTSAPLAAQPAAAVAEPALSGPCADAAPGSHVEAACEGPTEDNPSLSIKKRLKRAQFFDQREQLAAAGMAVPVEADAGLPDALEAPELVPSAREPA
jgi:resuscitation-promoting factor RpfA